MHVSDTVIFSAPLPTTQVKLGADGIILPDWGLGQYNKLPESARLYLQDQITTQAFCFTNH